MEGIFVEMNFQKCKWLLFGSYHPPSQSQKYFLDYVSFRLDVLTKNKKIFASSSVKEK